MIQSPWQHRHLALPGAADQPELLRPSVVVSELEQVAADAIRTAFHPSTPDFTGQIDLFLADR